MAGTHRGCRPLWGKEFHSGRELPDRTVRASAAASCTIKLAAAIYLHVAEIEPPEANQRIGVRPAGARGQLLGDFNDPAPDISVCRVAFRGIDGSCGIYYHTLVDIVTVATARQVTVRITDNTELPSLAGWVGGGRFVK